MAQENIVHFFDACEWTAVHFNHPFMAKVKIGDIIDHKNSSSFLKDVKAKVLFF